MNDMGDVEFLLKDLAMCLDIWCDTCENGKCILCPALGLTMSTSAIIERRYGMNVVYDDDSDFVKAENSVCSLTVKRERKYKNDEP